MKKRPLILFTLVFIFVLFGGQKVFSVDQIKTTEYFVAGYASQVSSQVDSVFSIYIGDNISTIANAVKSVYFPISGVYTGSGTLQLQINSDSNSLQSFTLPNVGTTPTPFEVLYKDPSNIINPTTSGNYSYTLNIIPSGITISGLGAKAVATYQYAPPSCADGTTQKIKTTEYFVAGYASQVSSQVDPVFSIYIGDNISTIANAVKSVYFPISGVYTGSGTLQLQINSDSNSLQSFTLPNVGTTPTPFEVLYKDPSSIINPTTSGNYSYTLNIIPSGITISGLGAKAVATYQYAPPSCVSGYPATGEITSAVFDTGVVAGAAYNSAYWIGSLGGIPAIQGKVRLQLATSNSSTGPWNFIGGAGCSAGDWYDLGDSNSKPVELTCAPANHNNQRYFRYQVQICSNDCVSSGNYTPVINNIVISWSP